MPTIRVVFTLRFEVANKLHVYVPVRVSTDHQVGYGNNANAALQLYTTYRTQHPTTACAAFYQLNYRFCRMCIFQILLPLTLSPKGNNVELLQFSGCTGSA